MRQNVQIDDELFSYIDNSSCLFVLQGLPGDSCIMFLTYWRKNVCSGILCCNCTIEEEKLKKKKEEEEGKKPNFVVVDVELDMVWCVFVGEIQKIYLDSYVDLGHDLA